LYGDIGGGGRRVCGACSRAANVLEKSVETTRGMGGRDGGVLLAFDERGRISGRGMTS